MLVKVLAAAVKQIAAGGTVIDTAKLGLESLAVGAVGAGLPIGLPGRKIEGRLEVERVEVAAVKVTPWAALDLLGGGHSPGAAIHTLFPVPLPQDPARRATH